MGAELLKRKKGLSNKMSTPNIGLSKSATSTFVKQKTQASFMKQSVGVPSGSGRQNHVPNNSVCQVLP